MAFKRNEPGCRCCGYGLSASLGGVAGVDGPDDIKVYIPGPPATFNNEDVLMKSTSTLNLIPQLGVGTRNIGTDPDEGKILLQQTDGDIYYVQAKTHEVALLWDSSTDVGSREIEYLYYQSAYGYAGGYTTVSDGSEFFTVDTTGTFVVTPFTMPSGPNIQTSWASVAVDTDGNIYAGYTTDVTGLSIGDDQTWYFLKNGVQDAYCKSKYQQSENGLFPTGRLNVWEVSGNNIYDVYSSKAGFLGGYTVEVNGAEEITTIDLEHKISDDVKGIEYTPLNIQPYSQYNVEHETIDIMTSTPKGGWFRFTKDLGLLVHMTDQFAASVGIMVTHSCDCG